MNNLPAKSSPPNHIGLILDGNRRWARARGLTTFDGHKAGYDNLKEIVKAAINRGVKFVSAYIFSTENWNRAPAEVKYLMDLAYTMLTRDVGELNAENIRVLWLGSTERVSPRLQRAIRQAEQTTAGNTRGTLGLCFNYGGQQEIVDAVKNYVQSGNAISSLTVNLLSIFAYAPEIPEVDLIIRTSGEQRLSGFMLWRTAYSELYFTDKHWPDFATADLDQAIDAYTARERRMGR